MAELPICTSTWCSLGGLVACLVPPVCSLLWVGGSLHLARLGAEVQQPPRQHPGSRQQLDAAPTPPAGINAWELARSRERQEGRVLGGGKGLNPFIPGLLSPPSHSRSCGGTPGSALGCTLVEGFVLSSCFEVAEQGRLRLMRQVPGLQTLRI